MIYYVSVRLFSSCSNKKVTPFSRQHRKKENIFTAEGRIPHF